MLIIVPLCHLKPEDLELVEKNRITELENIYFAVFFKDYMGIIFYIPDERIYGCEFIYEGDNPMLITWGCYVQYLNLLGVALEKSYHEYLELNKELEDMLKL
jgi:hypothetical protein